MEAECPPRLPADSVRTLKTWSLVDASALWFLDAGDNKEDQQAEEKSKEDESKPEAADKADDN